jgi:NAD dependent epimerase/dehydratase
VNYKGRKVLVTGADGFIGSHLVERLVAGGATVTALSLYNSFDSHGWLDDLPADVVGRITLARGDVRDTPFVRRLVERQEIVFHLAALISIPYSYTAPQSFVDVNVTGTLNVLEAARTHGVARVIHTSTSEVYGTAQYTPIDEKHPLQGQSPYSASKIGADKMAEAYARSFDLPVVTLRPFNTYGPRQSERAVIPTIIRQCLDPSCAAIKVGDLAPTRDFNYVGDTVEAFAAAGLAEKLEYGTAYNTGTGTAVTIGEVADMLRRLTGTTKQIEKESARIRPEHSEVRTLLADNRRLVEATGWRPRVSLEDGLSRTIAWWKERIKAGRTRPSSDYVT